MSWEDIQKTPDNGEEAKQAHETAADIAKAYHAIFNSPNGKKVLTHLNQKFVYDNKTELTAPNINYEAAYHNGEANVIKTIIQLIQQAEVL